MPTQGQGTVKVKYICLAASRPNPLFPPVMMTVRPAKLVVGIGGVWSWPWRNPNISVGPGIFVNVGLLRLEERL